MLISVGADQLLLVEDSSLIRYMQRGFVIVDQQNVRKMTAEFYIKVS